MRQPLTRWSLTLALLLGALTLPAPAAALLPLLDLSESLVAPGDRVRVTVAGSPGAFFALGASTRDAGLVVGDTALDLGPDAQLVGAGQLDALGRARVEFVPAFGAAAKLYLQAITAPTPDFAALDATPGKVLRSLDLLRSVTVSNPAPPAGPAGPAGRDAADREPGPTRDAPGPDAPAPDAPTATAPTAARTADLALTGNLLLPASSPTAGNVLQGGTLFLHAFGVDNTFLGANAGNLSVTGTGNTASGVNALRNNTTGAYNTASGANALFSNTSGIHNTASGVQALLSNTTGNYNTASGDNALFTNTSGGNNTASGSSALFSNTTGTSNTASGSSALFLNTTGNFNIALGESAGLRATTGSNNIYIGHQGVAAEGNTLRLGTSGSQTRAFVAGIRGVITGAANALAVLVDSNGQLGTVSSSRRVKEDIRDMGDASAGLLRLRPVTFRYTAAHAPGARPRQYGLLAEDVAEIYPDLVVHTPEGEVLSVQYHVLPALLLNEFQRLHRQVQSQADQIRALTARSEPEIRTPAAP